MGCVHSVLLQLKQMCPPRPLVQVSHRFPMERVHEAFQAMLQRKVMGKAILVMQGSSRL